MNHPTAFLVGVYLLLTQAAQAQRSSWIRDSVMTDTVRTYLVSRISATAIDRAAEMLGQGLERPRMFLACNTRDKRPTVAIGTVLPVEAEGGKPRLVGVVVRVRTGQSPSERETWLTRVGQQDVVWPIDAERETERWKVADYLLIVLPLEGKGKTGVLFYLDGLAYQLNWLTQVCASG